MIEGDSSNRDRYGWSERDRNGQIAGREIVRIRVHS